jgi:hypothetical protein
MKPALLHAGAQAFVLPGLTSQGTGPRVVLARLTPTLRERAMQRPVSSPVCSCLNLSTVAFGLAGTSAH